jgi:N-acetylmuramic acid 6-phosphate etherase
MLKNDKDMRFQKITETESLYKELEQMSTGELLENINREDRKVAEAVYAEVPKIAELVEEIVRRMRLGGRIFYLGAGTSGRLGVLDASEIPPTYGMPDSLVIGLIAGGDTALRHPVEAAEDDMEKGWQELLAYAVNKKDTVIGIAASGTTPYVIGVLRKAKENGLFTASIACNPGSPVSKEADIAIEIVVGPEFVTGSTRMKSGTAQKMVLNMISTATMIRLGRVKGNRMVHMQLTNRKLIERGSRMLMEELRIDYEQARHLLLLHQTVQNAIDYYRGQEEEAGRSEEAGKEGV